MFFIGLLSVFAGGGMLMPTTFEFLSNWDIANLSKDINLRVFFRINPLPAT